MFLIEFNENTYIDAERIVYLCLDNNKVTFTIDGEPENIYKVDSSIECQFLNQLQALNSNIADVSGRHHHINNPNTKY